MGRQQKWRPLYFPLKRAWEMRLRCYKSMPDEAQALIPSLKPPAIYLDVPLHLLLLFPLALWLHLLLPSFLFQNLYLSFHSSLAALFVCHTKWWEGEMQSARWLLVVDDQSQKILLPLNPFPLYFLLPTFSLSFPSPSSIALFSFPRELLIIHHKHVCIVCFVFFTDLCGQKHWYTKPTYACTLT